MLDFSRLRLTYEPFPVGHVQPVLSNRDYAALERSWPATELFEHKPVLGKKYSLSERNNSENYFRFLQESAPWRAFHDSVKNPDFVRQVATLLADQGIDLGLKKTAVAGSHGLSPMHVRIADRLAGKAWRRKRRRPRLYCRFEFSMMPADGGHILPHTDDPHKLITLVISMCRPEGWADEWGGGTVMLRTRDPAASYNLMNRKIPYQDTETLFEYPFVPNQCVLFIKTFNSLHAVRPMTGPATAMRRTLTINIEYEQ